MVVSAIGMTLTTGGVALATPSVSSVTVVRENPTTAELSVAIANPGTAEKTVELRYRPVGSSAEADWSTKVTFTTESAANVNLTGLALGTTYNAQAKVDSSSWSTETQFTTLPSEIRFRRPGESGVFLWSSTTTVAGSFIVFDYDSPYATDGAIVKNLYVRYYVEPSSYPHDWKTVPVSSTSKEKPSFRIDGLTPGTGFHLEVSLDSDFNNAFTVSIGIDTASMPRVSSVIATNITQTSAVINVELAHVDSVLDQPVYWHYRTVTQGGGTTEYGEWSDRGREELDREGGTFDLTGLTPNTTYEVEASLDYYFDASQSATSEPFTTTSTGLTALEVEDEDITKTGARVVATVKDPNGLYRGVHIRYRSYWELDSIRYYGDWTASTEVSITTDPDSQAETAALTLSGLLADTNYEVQASLDNTLFALSDQDLESRLQQTSDPVLIKDTTFKTLSPRVTTVAVSDEEQTKATLTATIDYEYLDGREQTVFVRYRSFSYVNGVPANYGDWFPTEEARTNTNTAVHPLTNLLAGTNYQVEAWVDDTVVERKSTDFATEDPIVSGVAVVPGSVSESEAQLKVDITPHGGGSLTVYLRYSVAGEGAWTSEPCETTTADPNSCTVSLLGLTASTDYEVEASLEDFSTVTSPEKETTTFTTLLAPPSVTITSGSITQTTATITVAFDNPGAAEKKIHLQYRTTTPEGEWEVPEPTTDTGSSVDFELEDLKSGTEYEVWAWLEGEFDRRGADTFPTHPPRIGGVTIINKTSTAATVKVSILGPNGRDQPIFMQYRSVTPSTGDWSERRLAQGAETAELLLKPLTVDTRYLVWLVLPNLLESSLAELREMPADQLFGRPKWEVTFSTSAIVLSVDDITRTSALVKTELTDPETADDTVYVRYRKETDPSVWLDSQPLEGTSTSQQQGGQTTKGEEGGSKTTKGSEDNAGDMVRELKLTGLTAGTRYEVEASFQEFDADSRVIFIDTFITLPAPTGNNGGGNNGGGNNGGGNNGGGNNGGGNNGGGNNGGGNNGGDNNGGGDNPAPPLQVEYTDVPNGHTHYDAISAMAATGMFLGTECRPGEFCPERPIPRWVMAVWLVRLVDGKDPVPASANRSVDVNPGKWWAAHVERLWDLGITIGCQGRTEPVLRYCPEAFTTRAQMASFLVRMYKFAPAVEAGFVDTAHSSHAPDIDSLYAVGVTRGCGADPLRYCPEEPTSRAEMATFLYRARPHLS